MARILVVANAQSPLARERGIVGQRAGHEVCWVSLAGETLPGVRMFTVPPRWRRVRFVRGILTAALVVKALRQVRPHLVHVHYALQGPSTLPLLRHPAVIVSIMGGDVLPEQGYRGVNAVLGKRLLDHAACITSKSAFLDRALARIGDYQGKIRRVTWGVDLDRFRPDRDVTRLRDRLAIPQGHLVFFDPRMATAFYNKHVILGAFSRFVKLRRAAAVLVIAELFPDSAYVAALRRQSRELGVDENVRFVGHVPHEDMADYYALADVTISVPRSDGLPQTIYEALACGSFLVVGDLVQYRELVEDRATAYLVPVGDESALTSALDWVATHRDVRDRAAPLGRRLVEIHADRRIQEEVVTGIYGELLDRRTLREGATSESRRQDSFSR